MDPLPDGHIRGSSRPSSFRSSFFKLVQQIDVIGVIQFEPLGDGGDRAPAPVGKGGDDAFAKVGVEDFADADHSYFACFASSRFISLRHRPRV